MKILYFTNIFPHYRTPIWKELINSNQFSIEFFYSKSKLNQIEGVNLEKTFGHENISKFHYIKNYKIFGHIVWQSMSIKKSIFSNYDIIILLGDMKILSNWIVSLISHFRNKKVVFWTHGIYGNEGYFKKKLRLLFLSLSHKILLYENNAKNQLVMSGLNPNDLHVVYNSLDFNIQKKLFEDLSQKQHFQKNNRKKIIFIGRLTKIKKLDMLINVINRLNENIPLYDLKLIGDGPERSYLKSLSKKGIQNGYITFFGPLYDEEKIAKLIFDSDLCVAPGNIGLTCIHSLTYGTPVCTHSNIINQMPEFEAIKEGVNGTLFKEDDIDDLELKIKTWFEKYHQKNTKLSIRKVVDEDYNPHNQIRIINNMIDKWQK